MIFIGLGANLPTEEFGTPLQGLKAALACLEGEGVKVARCSPWYRSAPVPLSDQPWFYNAVASVTCHLAPQALLSVLLRCESRLGRVRAMRNEPRVVDLDLLDYGGQCLDLAAGEDAPALVLPHPRLAGRAFVLYPLRDIAPLWRDPVGGELISDLINALDGDQIIKRVE